MIRLPVVGSDRPAIVDDCHSNLIGYRWRFDKDGYVMRKAKGRRIYLHHVVLPGHRYPRFLRDHVNRNKLDNRSSNLRWLDSAQSAQNKNAYDKNLTGHRGVMKIGRRFRATVTVNGVVHRLGLFDDAEIAGRAAAEQRRVLMPFSAEGANA